MAKASDLRLSVLLAIVGWLAFIGLENRVCCREFVALLTADHIG